MPLHRLGDFNLPEYRVVTSNSPKGSFWIEVNPLMRPGWYRHSKVRESFSTVQHTTDALTCTDYWNCLSRVTEIT